MTHTTLVRSLIFALILVTLVGCGNGRVTPTPPTNPPTTPPTTPTPPATPTPPTPPPTTPLPPSAPGNNSISGGVALSGAADLSGIYILGCLEDETCPAQTVTDASGGYVLSDLQAVPYIVLALADLDSSGGLTPGDYFGFYSTDGSSPTPLTPPQEAANITLALYDGGNEPTPDPNAGGSISGTITAPGEVAGSWVVIACYSTESGCDETRSVSSDPVQQSGTSLAYSFDDLTAGQYAIIALADSDGNGSYEDANDYIGVYPAESADSLVSPPATGIDVQMVTRAELDSSSTTQLKRVHLPSEMLERD